MIGVLLVSLMAAAAAAAPTAPTAASVGAEPCPAPKTLLPRYPVHLLRAKLSGLVLVGARFDDCGRIVETRIDESSGRDAFDESATAAVAQFVLSPEQRAKAREGWVQVPMKFGGVRTYNNVPRIPWPRSHARPRYLPDGSPLPFESIDDFRQADVVIDEGVMQPPYEGARDASGRYVGTSMRPDRRDPMVFWLTYRIHAPQPESPAEPFAPSTATAVARYRLVEENGVPVVRLGMLCERPADECERLREFLLKGLPFARPRRR